MEPRKSLTLNGINGVNFLFIINAVAMISVSIYLTTHFYDTLYPTTLGQTSSLCNLSTFFNCDAATYSKLSNLAGIPISFFGIIVGLLFLISSLMPSEALERTSSAVAKYNFIGCVALFIFSLVSLGSLCPFCTVYYVLSGLAFFLVWKYGINSWVPDTKTAGLWAGILIAGSVFFYTHTAGKEDASSKLNASTVEQFNRLNDFGDPDVESAFKIHMGEASFAASPIRVSVFSDFECPFCKVVSDQMHELARRYPKQLSVQYLFFPMDNKCNSNVKGNFHQHACAAAYVAACDPKKFATVHDKIFAEQDRLKSGELLGKIMKDENLAGCLENEEVKNLVIATINQGTKYNIKATPTIIINGKKIEGTIATVQFMAIFDSILAGK
jgi:protein-disulfide isomerase/uncharacterized membrane protein